MTGNIKFSIMVPVYNVEEYLDDCVKSILNQSYENFELILVDDGSKDRSGEICDMWAEKDSRIKVYHKPNGGLPSARSCALEHADGDYYLFADSDDYVSPDMMEVLYGKISETDCDCIFFSLEKKLGDKVIERAVCDASICGRVHTDKRFVLNIVLGAGGYNSLCRKCVKAACFDGRDYTPYFHIQQGEDLVRSLEIYENAKSFLFMQNVFYYYRCNFSSIQNSMNCDKLEADNTIELMVDALLEKTGVFEKEDYDRLRNRRLDVLAISLRKRARECSSRKIAVERMKKVRDNPYYSDMTETGYRKVECYPGQGKAAVRKMIFRINIFLFRHRLYRLFIFADSLMRGR